MTKEKHLYLDCIACNSCFNFIGNTLYTVFCFIISTVILSWFSDISGKFAFCSSMKVILLYFFILAFVLIVFLIIYFWLIKRRIFYSTNKSVKKKVEIVQLESNKPIFVDVSLVIVFFAIILLVSDHSTSSEYANSKIYLLSAQYLIYIIVFIMVKSIYDSILFNNMFSDTFLNKFNKKGKIYIYRAAIKEEACSVVRTNVILLSDTYIDYSKNKLTLIKIKDFVYQVESL